MFEVKASELPKLQPSALYVVATPIGNLEDITLRALHVLASVDRIAAEDTRHSQRLLQNYQIATPMLSLHEHNEEARQETILEQLRGGASIALISDAGTPLINDPGFKLVRACREQGFDVYTVPGPSAVIAALSVAGLPTDQFHYYGFLPAKSGTRKNALQSYRQQTATMVFYESVHRLEATVADFIEVFGTERRMVIAKELTKPFEQVFLGTVVECQQWLRDNPDKIRGEFVLMLEGCTESADEDMMRRLLPMLLRELKTKAAVKIVSEITGVSKNQVYALALELSS